jgi:hypothetical protein
MRMQDGSRDEVDVTIAAEIDVGDRRNVGRSGAYCEFGEHGGGVDGAHDVEGAPVVGYKSGYNALPATLTARKVSYCIWLGREDSNL